MNRYIFFLGGYDAEMLEILNILQEKGEPFFDKHLSWGASLSEYESELKNLPDDIIPVFIELKADCPYPENAILIDHHDELSGKDRKTSIEQIADLLGIRLNRRQQLISANDRGHIREMRRTGATEEEISEIRESDRRAQGVTVQDEQNAEASVRNRLERFGDRTAVIDSLTNKTAAVFDRVYGQYDSVFVYTPDGEMNCSGKGEMICRLVRIYKEKQQNDLSVIFWWGGGLPDYGYFGTNNPMSKEELKAMVNKADNRIISQHIFMFPFRISDKNRTENQPADISDVFHAFEQSGWNYKPYSVKTGSDYSEYFYFHDYVRKAVFETKSLDEIRKCFSRKDTTEVVSYYFERETDKDSRVTIHIKEQEKPYELKISHLSLRLFETGVGIISVELLNHTYQEINDVLCINDFGRRIYPQFLANKESGGIEASKYSFLADRIEFQCNGLPSSDERFSFEKYCRGELQVAEYMKNLMGEAFLQKFRFVPIIDDRMFTVCWYGSDCRSRKLSEKNSETGDLAYKTSDEWYKFIFVDGKTMGCASEQTKRELIKENTYYRWAEWGTLYGVTRYSLMCLTNSGNIPYNVIRHHIETMYYQIAVILLAQRASILRFSADVARISGKIEAFSRADGNTDDPERFREIADEVKMLHSVYIRFINRLWFTEVTPQEQGIELYDMALKAMDLEKQMNELRHEIKELYEFVDMNYEKIRNKSLNLLNVLAFLFMPATLITGFWGMNLYFITSLPDMKEGGSIGSKFCVSFLLFILAVTGAYAVLKKLLKATGYEGEVGRLITLDILYQVLTDFWVIIVILSALWLFFIF